MNSKNIIAVRLRGNSAQQMGEFGRKPSRESVVVFRKARKQEKPRASYVSRSRQA